MKKIITQERILNLVEIHPGISSIAIADNLGMHRASIFRHLQDLQLLHKIESREHGKATRYFPIASYYMDSGTDHDSQKYTSDFIISLKQELIIAMQEAYDEDISESYIDETFETYCMYIAPDATILTGFSAFIAWCMDLRHDFSDRIIPKALEYLQITSSVEVRRRRSGFLDATEVARANLTGIMEVAFDVFLFLMPSVLESGFGRTRTALELYYGKINNPYLLEQAIISSIDPIRRYLIQKKVDAYIFTPPTNSRPIQFRDVLKKKLDIRLPIIKAEKINSLGKALRSQKEIQGKDKKKERVENAIISLEVTIPQELTSYEHIVIFDDSFTTGATPNAIALRLREAGYVGKISIITICGSFDYDLAITEDEI
jgi:hypothetical protein